MAYHGQILDGYKDAAIVKADNFDATALAAAVVGTALVWDTTNRQWILPTAVTEEELGFCLENVAETGSDAVASGKLPVVVKNAWVATDQFCAAGGAVYVPLVADVGDFVQINAATPGTWELIAAPGAGETYAGILRDVATINGLVMGIFDFEPRLHP